MSSPATLHRHYMVKQYQKVWPLVYQKDQKPETGSWRRFILCVLTTKARIPIRLHCNQFSLNIDSTNALTQQPMGSAQRMGRPDILALTTRRRCTSLRAMMTQITEMIWSGNRRSTRFEATQRSTRFEANHAVLFISNTSCSITP